MIARTVLPIRYIGSDKDYDTVKYFDLDHLETKISTDHATFIINGNTKIYKIWNIATGWTSKSSYKSDKDLNSEKEKIYRVEDIAFLNGWNGTDIDGIYSTNTIRYNIADAIKEFEPKYFITSSNLKPDNVITVKTDILEDNIHYLTPYDPTITELVISRDIEYNEPTETKKYIKNKWIGTGKWTHIIDEWATIEIHNKDKFIKVIT